MIRPNAFLIGPMLLAAVWCPGALAAAEAGKPAQPELLPDDVYAGYRPEFWNDMPESLAKVSLQDGFYNRAAISSDQRADALIGAGIKAEQAGEYEEAAKHYQKVIDHYPESLIQVSSWGVFLPASRYAQIRLLKFPPKALAYYRRAREAYEGARARNSVEGLHDVVNYYLATRYGAAALFEIGNGALDRGEAENAARCFEQMRQYYPAEDYDGAAVAGRLALAKAALAPLQAFEPQRRNPRYQSFSDYAWWPAPATTLSGAERRWDVELPQAPFPTVDDALAKGDALPFHLPWIVGNDFYYKHYNRVYCRSLVSGEQRWECDLGLLNRYVRRLTTCSNGNGTGSDRDPPLQTFVQADEDILVDDACVYANLRIFGPHESLVALDRVTGTLRWSAGPFRPQSEDDLSRNYDGTPALGRYAVYAPWSQEEGEGGDLYTTVGLSAFDKETGRMLWERTLCRLSPTATTQKKWGIRVVSSTPLVKEGIVYHVTGAGVVAALDEVSGAVLWLMRYPHDWGEGGGVYDAHDNVLFGLPGMPGAGPVLRNAWPLIQGARLYVAPFDSKRFLCLDKETGKVMWSLAPAGPFEGVAPGGELVFSQQANMSPPLVGGEQRGRGYEFRRADSGKFAWGFFPAWHCYWHQGGRYYPGRYEEMDGDDRPVFTEDGRMLMVSTDHHSWWGVSRGIACGEWCLSVPQRKLLDYRVQYKADHVAYVRSAVEEFVKNSKEAWRWQPDRMPDSVNTFSEYRPVKRMPFRHHGVLFEMLDSGGRLGMAYDAQALRAAVEGKGSARETYTAAELALTEGRDDAALEMLKKCLRDVKPEEATLTREIRQMLFRLSRVKAWKALLAGDPKAAHRHLERMAEMANTAEEEALGLTALAESFERQGDPDRAAACWVNLMKHYRPVVCEAGLPDLEAGAGGEMLARALRAGVGRAPAESDLLLGVEEYAAWNLHRLLAGSSALQPQLEARAERAVKEGGPSLDARLRAIAVFPGTQAARRILQEAWEGSAAAEPQARQVRRWYLQDLALLQGIAPSPQAGDEARFVWKDPAAGRWGTTFTETRHDFPDYGDNLRLLLRRTDATQERPNLLFVGGRSKKRLDNKFSLECWDMGKDCRLWSVADIRLKGKGDEPGVTEALLAGDTVIVHGKYDVLAWETATGKLRWRWEAPLDFDLRDVAQMGDLIVLAGARHTMGLQRVTGRMVWSAEERGELYCAPILRTDLLVSVRRDPCGVTFRRPQTGRLMWTIKLDELSACTQDPIFSAEFTRGMLDNSAATDVLPVADGGDLLLLSDRANYVAIDLAKGRIRWRRPIDNNDRFDPPLRFSVCGSYVTVLKRDYTSPAFYMLDAQSGKIKWMKKDQGAVFSACLDTGARELYGIVAPDLKKRGWTLACLDAETGTEKRRLSRSDWEVFPETQILGMDVEGRLAVRFLTGKGKPGELWLVDGKGMKGLQTLAMEGAAEFGIAGGKSCISQDGYEAVLWPGKMRFCRKQEQTP